MEDTNSIGPFLSFGIVIVFGTWLFFVIMSYVLAYKHDSYVKKHFPKLAKTESVSVFGGNWNGISSVMNIFSSTKTAPDEYVSIMRRKIRYSLFGMFLSITLLPFGGFMLLLLVLALRYWLT
jgi:hypothetical protein